MSGIVPFRFFLAALLFSVATLLTLAPTTARAQGQRRVVQFTGIVATGDSLLGVPGAGVFVPTAIFPCPCWPVIAS
jgi:hypothetical protein